MVKDHSDSERRKKEMFYLMMHSTHFIYGYMASDHSDSERGNLLPPHGLLFPISSKDSFICSIPQCSIQSCNKSCFAGMDKVFQPKRSEM